ncbi:MAG TPA: nuclear transport factor 2 family protein [Acidimicrobiales bacterium]
MDWPAWAAHFEQVKGPDEFEAIFAVGGQFCDPVTPWTTDVRQVAIHTDEIFPDWRQRVNSIRGGDDWAVFEWTGTATFPVEGKASIPIVMQGATVIAVDGDGKVTSWRDYLDTNEPTQQIMAGLAK